MKTINRNVFRTVWIMSLAITMAISGMGVATANAFNLPDTGITKCYDDTKEIPCPQPGQDYYGQDGNYNINPMSYTKLDAAGKDLPDSATSWVMVRDNNTGLIWEMKTSKDGVKNYADPHDADNTYTWYDPNPATNGGNAGTAGNGTDTQDFIDALNTAKFGGYSDWRMPSIEELRSIVDYSYPGPIINKNYFPNTIFFYYWSSSSEASTSYYAWRMDFHSGTGAACYTDKPTSFFVRAVRGGQSATSPRFTDNGNGTVTDIRSGLMWQQATGNNGVKMTWKAALAYCENLTLGGYTDWRMPNIKELTSLLDLSRDFPAIDTGYFSDTKTNSYWSSSNLIGSYYAWIIDFSLGCDWSDHYKFSSDYVRCARNGGGASASFEKGDLNHLNGVDLVDALLALKVVSGLNPSGIFLATEVNGDGKIGLEEVIYILRVIAGLGDKFTNSVGMTFKLIPADTFTMGSPETELGRESDETQHQVTLSKSFYMQTTEVTQGQWKAVMNSNPSLFSVCGDNCPVDNVSWNDAQAFIAEMNKSGEGTYRLPTEAEWEYAARAGSTTAYPNGGISNTESDPNMDKIGWYWGNSTVSYSPNENGHGTHPVAQKQANAYGLYDMHGNILEWVQDWGEAYPSGAVTDPTGPASGTVKVFRGGSWIVNARICRSAERSGHAPGDRSWWTGFRLVREQ